MAKKELHEIIAEYQNYGFDQDLIQIAYSNVNGDGDKVLDQILRLQDQSSQYPTVPIFLTKKPSNPQDEDAQLSKAIEMSMNEAK